MDPRQDILRHMMEPYCWISSFLYFWIVLFLAWPPLVAGNEVPNAGPRGTDGRLYSMSCGNTSDVLGKSPSEIFLLSGNEAASPLKKVLSFRVWRK